MSPCAVHFLIALTTISCNSATTVAGPCSDGHCAGSISNGVNDDELSMLQISNSKAEKAKIKETNAETETADEEQEDSESTEDEFAATEDVKGDVEGYTVTGKGQCEDEDGTRKDIGWALCEFGAGSCASVEDCVAACSSDADCAAFNYYAGHCWMFAKMEKPYVKNNNAFNWYDCYIKEPEAPVVPPPPGPKAGECDKGMTVPLAGKSPGPYISKTTQKTTFKCSKKCKNTKKCKAIIYHPQTTVCFLLSRKYNGNYQKSKTGSVVSNKC